MVIPNILILLSGLVLLWSLISIYMSSNGRAYYVLIFGGLFLLLNVIVPLIVNLNGYAYSVRWGQDLKIKDDNVYMVYCLYVLGLSIAYGGVSLALKKGLGFGWVETKDLSWLKMLHFLSGISVVAGFFIFVYGTGMSLFELFGATRFAWFANETVVEGILNTGLYFVSLVAVYAYLDVRLGFPNKWLSVLVYTVVVLMVLVSGGRKWIIFFMSGVLAGYFQKKGRVEIKIKHLMSVLLVIVFISIWQYGRNIDSTLGEGFSEQLYEKSLSDGEAFYRGDASYFYRASLEAIDLNYNQGVLYPGAILLRIVLMPVPRGWSFGVKPEGIPATFAKDIGAVNEARDGNMPPGIIGAFALSFGSILGSVLFAIMVPTLLICLEVRAGGRVGLLSVPLSAYFISAATLLLRGSSGGLYFMAFGVVFVFIVYWASFLLGSFRYRSKRWL